MIRESTKGMGRWLSHPPETSGGRVLLVELLAPVEELVGTARRMSDENIVLIGDVGKQSSVVLL